MINQTLFNAFFNAAKRYQTANSTPAIARVMGYKSATNDYVTTQCAYAPSYLPEQADTVRIEISRSTGWDGERDGVKYKTAHVHPTMDGKAVYGVYRIRLSFDRGGNVVELYLIYNSVEAKTDVSFKSAQKLQETLSAGDYAASVDQELQSYAIAFAELAYYMDADVNEAGDFCMYPVYILKGTGANRTGETQTFDVIVDAIA